MKKISKENQRVRRHERIRTRIAGTGEKPRLMVQKSNKHIYASLINDETGKTLCMVSDTDIKKEGKPQEIALEIGKEIAVIAKAKKIERVVFDRAGYLYHGVVKQVAEGARAGGLQF